MRIAGPSPRGNHLPSLLDQKDVQRQEPHPSPGRLRDHGQRHQHLLGQGECKGQDTGVGGVSSVGGPAKFLYT